jgi:hypothetical protein
VAGVDFEHYVAEVLHLNGHHAAVTKASGDYGVDLIVNGRIAVQVKDYATPVGPKAVQEVVAGMAYYRCEEAWVVTSSTFTKNAAKLAEVNGVRLITGEELDWMLANPDTTADHRERYEAHLAEVRIQKTALFTRLCTALHEELERRVMEWGRRRELVAAEWQRGGERAAATRRAAESAIDPPSESRSVLG